MNNGYVEDSFNGFSGPSTVVADFDSLVKANGFFQKTVIAQNGGKFQAGNSPGPVTVGKFLLGPAGVCNYVFAIDNAAGAVGLNPDVNAHVSGWGLVKVGEPPVIDRGLSTSSDFVWTDTPADN